MTWAERDGQRRFRTLRVIFRGLLAQAREYGGVLFEPGVGVVEWRGGEALDLGPLAVLRSGTWKVALVAPPAVWQRLSRHQTQASAVVRRHLDAGSVYLSGLGVEPALHGQGHGGRLLEQALVQQASRWSSCVLRTEQPRNVEFYEAHGFELVDHLTIEASGLPTWVFRRPLRSSPAAASA